MQALQNKGITFIVKLGMFNMISPFIYYLFIIQICTKSRPLGKNVTNLFVMDGKHAYQFSSVFLCAYYLFLKENLSSCEMVIVFNQNMSIGVHWIKHARAVQV